MKPMFGYTGKIARLHLDTKTVEVIETKKYEQWFGGHGIGTALFWDLVQEIPTSGFDPRNIITIMTSPLGGTLVPSGASRAEIQGVGVQSYPTEWFTRSNIGGRFAAMLKFAGWDGLVIEGEAAAPVWIRIVNDSVVFRDARPLWGKDTWQTQQAIWQEQGFDAKADWREVDGGDVTTQRPAVLTIGEVGEKRCRFASIVHDAGHVSGQGGFGAIWGAKRLKAISVQGSQAITVANPRALLEAWQWANRTYAKQLRVRDPIPGRSTFGWFNMPPGQPNFWTMPQQGRPTACIGCRAGCSATYSTGKGNEAKCLATMCYREWDIARHGKQTDATFLAIDLLNRHGINAYEFYYTLKYLQLLHRHGHLGLGKAIATDLPFEEIGSARFLQLFVQALIDRRGIGEDLAHGVPRAAKRWQRLEGDLHSGLLEFPYWGYPKHYDPRVFPEWGYGSILGDRDINEHEFNSLFWDPCFALWRGQKPAVPAGEVAAIVAKKLAPYEVAPAAMDSSENLYSQEMVKLVAWHRHFTRFWRQSALFCDFRWSDMVNSNTPDNAGIAGVAESRFLAAVTGKELSYRDGLRVGRRIWNVDNAIWTLQGRHRDQVHFAAYIYRLPNTDPGIFLPGRVNGEWSYLPIKERRLDKDRFEEWKTRYYRYEGWDERTGWPTRETLQQLGLEHIAERLAAHSKLGG